MNRTLNLLAAATAFALLAGCGGGDDAAPTSPVAPVPAPPSGSPPPATVGDNSTTAGALATEAGAAIAAAERRASLPGGTPGGVLLDGLPAGVVITTNCGFGGTFTYDYPTTFTGNTTYSITYNNCSYAAGYVFNGSYVINYSRFVSGTDFAWTATYNMSYTGPNNFNYTYAGTQTCSYSGTAYNCTYNDGTRTFGTNWNYSGGVIVSGSYQWSYASGTYTWTFTNWGATSGSATVTGPNFNATIVRNSATSVTITINGGTPRTVTIS